MPSLITRGLGGRIVIRGLGGSASATYPDLWAALQAWITAQVPALTGGVWATRAGGGQGFPYAEYDGSAGADETFNTSGEPLADGTFTVSVYAALKPDADALARAVRLAIKDAPLAFSDGQLIYLRGKNLAGAEADPDPGPDNETVYQAVLMGRYMVQRAG